MKWTIETGPGDRYLVVRTSGKYDIEAQHLMVTEILSHPSWHPGKAALFDHRELDLGQAGYESMARAAAVHRAHEDQIGDGKSALVMSTPGAFGTGRQFELLLGSDTAAKLRIFVNIDDAIRWLES